MLHQGIDTQQLQVATIFHLLPEKQPCMLHPGGIGYGYAVLYILGNGLMIVYQYQIRSWSNLSGSQRPLPAFKAEPFAATDDNRR